jgi:hypothetical protein
LKVKIYSKFLVLLASLTLVQGFIVNAGYFTSEGFQKATEAAGSAAGRAIGWGITATASKIAQNPKIAALAVAFLVGGRTGYTWWSNSVLRTEAINAETNRAIVYFSVLALADNDRRYKEPLTIENSNFGTMTFNMNEQVPYLERSINNEAKQPIAFIPEPYAKNKIDAGIKELLQSASIIPIKLTIHGIRITFKKRKGEDNIACMIEFDPLEEGDKARLPKKVNVRITPTAPEQELPSKEQPYQEYYADQKITQVQNLGELYGIVGEINRLLDVGKSEFNITIDRIKITDNELKNFVMSGEFKALPVAVQDTLKSFNSLNDVANPVEFTAGFFKWKLQAKLDKNSLLIEFQRLGQKVPESKKGKKYVSFETEPIPKEFTDITQLSLFLSALNKRLESSKNSFEFNIDLEKIKSNQLRSAMIDSKGYQALPIDIQDLIIPAIGADNFNQQLKFPLGSVEWKLSIKGTSQSFTMKFEPVSAVKKQ